MARIFFQVAFTGLVALSLTRLVKLGLLLRCLSGFGISLMQDLVLGSTLSDHDSFFNSAVIEDSMLKRPCPDICFPLQLGFFAAQVNPPRCVPILLCLFILSLDQG
jgi:hypothetical protein